jgi:transposase
LAQGDPTPPPKPPGAEPDRRRWRRCGLQRLPEHLPCERIEYKLTPDDLACPGCGCARVKMGEGVSEQLEYVPASMRVLQHVRFRYACHG